MLGEWTMVHDIQIYMEITIYQRNRSSVSFFIFLHVILPILFLVSFNKFSLLNAASTTVRSSLSFFRSLDNIYLFYLYSRKFTHHKKKIFGWFPLMSMQLYVNMFFNNWFQFTCFMWVSLIKKLTATI